MSTARDNIVGLMTRFRVAATTSALPLDPGTMPDAETAHVGKKPESPKTPAATLTTKERMTHIHIRGDYEQPGAEVQPGGLAVLPPLKPRGADAHPSGEPHPSVSICVNLWFQSRI